MAEHVIDATNAIVGRLAVHAAKLALKGETVKIINVEKAIMTGNRAFILSKYSRVRDERGQIRHGPYMDRRSDMFVRRIIRGMLPFEKKPGREAFRRVLCYIGSPHELKDAKHEALEAKANVSKLTNTKYITISELCKHLGAKA